MSKESKEFQVPVYERHIADYVTDFLSSNFNYDLDNETVEQNEYRHAITYSTIKAVRLFDEQTINASNLNKEVEV